jgi:hypothetical protein
MLSIDHTLAFLKAVASEIGVNNVRHEHKAIHVRENFSDDAIHLEADMWKLVKAPNGRGQGPLFLEQKTLSGHYERLEIVSLLFPEHEAFAVSNKPLLGKLVQYMKIQSVLYEHLPQFDANIAGTAAVMFRCRGSDQFIQVLHRVDEIFTDVWEPYKPHVDTILANGFLVDTAVGDIGLNSFLLEHNSAGED